MLLRWLLMLAMLFAAPSLARADERILSFHSDIKIAQDGSLDITESIRVRAENIQIRRGIYRELPTRYRGESGRVVDVGFELIDTWLDGAPVTTRIEHEANGVRIRMGDADRLVARGEHVYAIRYRVKRAIGFFDGYDEIYWNITGNDWSFPIDRASTAIALPQAATFGNRAFYTGRPGSTAGNARAIREEAGSIRIETTRGLAPREGLSVAVAFPKGIVTPPSAAEQQWRAIAAWLPAAAGLSGLLLVIFYYWYAWKHVGRDPRPGTVVPLFAPPDGMSPAEIRYLVKQRIDDRAFAAAMVEAGVKGHIRLVEESGGLLSKGKTRIDRMGRDAPKRPLGKAEVSMLDRLLDPGQSLKIEQEHHADFAAARRRLGRHFSDIHTGKSFHRNGSWAAAGVLVWILSIWLTSIGVVLAADAANPLHLLLAIAGTAIGALLFFGAPEDGAALRWPIIIFAILFGLAGFISGFPFIPMAVKVGGPAPVLIPAFIGGVVMLSGFFWMSAPTVAGRARLDEVAGFKQYLATVEGERYDRMQAPTESLALFERFLPYAIALGVENRWADRFKDRLEAASTMPGRQDDHFLWYSGSHSPWSNPGGFSKAMGASLAGSIASAATAPGSSSGSGGGGFSGGGGGGGGGGGW
ncbi:DUF2207 domain-containing protein [Sphingomicrobium flavum]|uniref:DUF2207 domain-containing protein n=1 Tax=Sphingomicrobium flavum TaxID=1229164 RepID=UPI0021AD90EF|nr:DUF2207 domain-containing protein [Sphingomicrobium flavum]